MKNKFRVIALCLALVTVCALFAGCGAIDDMRANHAVLSEDRETISFRGATYKRLPAGAEIFFYSPFSITDILEDQVRVTEHDVPVLLKNEFFEDADYDSENDLFCAFLDVEDYEGVHSKEYIYYCNEKDYDAYIESINKGVYDRVGVSVGRFNEENAVESAKLVVLSEATSNELKNYGTNVAKTMSKETYEFVETKTLGGLYQLMGCSVEGKAVNYKQWTVDFSIEKTGTDNVYLVSEYLGYAVKLSDEASEELLPLIYQSDSYYW